MRGHSDNTRARHGKKFVRSRLQTNAGNTPTFTLSRSGIHGPEGDDLKSTTETVTEAWLTFKSWKEKFEHIGDLFKEGDGEAAGTAIRTFVQDLQAKAHLTTEAEGTNPEVNLSFRDSKQLDTSPKDLDLDGISNAELVSNMPSSFFQKFQASNEISTDILEDVKVTLSSITSKNSDSNVMGGASFEDYHFQKLDPASSPRHSAPK